MTKRPPVSHCVGNPFIYRLRYRPAQTDEPSLRKVKNTTVGWLWWKKSRFFQTSSEYHLQLLIGFIARADIFSINFSDHGLSNGTIGRQIWHLSKLRGDGGDLADCFLNHLSPFHPSPSLSLSCSVVDVNACFMKRVKDQIQNVTKSKKR